MDNREEVLEILKTSEAAYQAESEERWDQARDLHSQARERLIKKEADRKQRELARLVQSKISLHEERIAVLLGPYLSSPPQPQPAAQVAHESAVESPLVGPPPEWHPTALNIARQLGARDASRKALREFGDSFGDDDAASGQVNLTKQELRTPQEANAMLPPFRNSIKPSQPSAETWVIRRDTSNHQHRLDKTLVFTVKNATETRTLYIAEVPNHDDQPIPLVALYRAGEYPTSCVRVMVHPIERRVWRHHQLYRDTSKARRLVLDHYFLPKHVVEVPDLAGAPPWSPRRFIYGGRTFVWKPEDRWSRIADDQFETLLEYRWTLPPADAMGDGMHGDDAEEGGGALFWGENVRDPNNPSASSSRGYRWQVYFAAGVDAVFKEVILASQLTKMLITHSGHLLPEFKKLVPEDEE